VAKTFYATKRARPDTCTSISFLTTRVREPDTDDWSKLAHLMKYLRGTLTLTLILSANGSGILKWYMDASFAVHSNMRGHSGGGLTLGRGFPIVSSTKQKLNTKSSTESEIVGVDDFMPAIWWTRYFMKAQGYDVKDNVLYQDNKSSILLEKNGKASSGKRMKHINNRYFFITDRVNKNEVSAVWCPTEDLILDYATKPLKVLCSRRSETKSREWFRRKIRGQERPSLRAANGLNSRVRLRKERQMVWSRQVKGGTTGVCWELRSVRRTYAKTKRPVRRLVIQIQIGSVPPWFLRRMFGLTMWDVAEKRIKNEQFRRMVADSPTIDSLMETRRCRWHSKLSVMIQSRSPRRILGAWCTTSRPVGRLQQTIRHAYISTLKKFSFEGEKGQLREWMTVARDR
jgi:hypothetical protein